jgi:hypothetical protein
MFNWIPIHREAIHRILEYRQNEKELLRILSEMEQQGLKVISLQDKGADGKTTPLAEIDPFTFLASFNRGVTDKNRRENWSFLKARWDLKAPVPDDFIGIPILHNMSSWLFPYAGKREKDHVGFLWKVAAMGEDGDIEKVGEELFDRCLKLKKVGVGSLTIGLFWINPEKFLPADHKTTAYGRANGITTEPEDYQSYRQWLKEMSKQLGNNYPQMSHAAHLLAVQGKSWGFAKWMGPVLDALRALGGSGTPKLVQQQIQQALNLPDSVLAEKNKSGQTKFYNEINWARQYLVWEALIECPARGQWVLTEQGKQTVLDQLKAQAIAEKWAALHKQSDGEAPDDDIAPSPEDSKDQQGGLQPGAEPKPVVVAPSPPTRAAYWWLNANPKIWDFGALPIGGKESYTSHNEKGHKRRIYQRFLEVKPGDLVVGYIGQPQKELVAVCRITRGLHQTENGAQIEFEKTEDLTSPIPYEILQANADLAKSEPFVNNLQGSLFKLTAEEYEIIRSLEDNPPPGPSEPYDHQKAREGLFLHPDQFKEVLDALKEKKNVVLQGAPGVGKTFIAERLAFAFIGFEDRQRVKMIQFHQSYSYEEFIQGFRPTAKGTFAMKYGIFHQFCRRAQHDEAKGKPYVFIIDEINRGNLSKIFGELMMLIEPDKRGEEYAIPLAYSENADEEFYIPKNLYLLGLMNTADRSLAMVDYALRRRFRFIPLQPEFASKAFASFLEQKKGASAELVHKIVSRMNALNKAIVDDKNLGSGFQIGHSYFCPQDDIEPDENWYQRVIRTEIVPLIQEYWFDEPKKVEKQQSDLLA